MDRRTLIGMVAGGLLTIRLAAYAQPSGRVYRLGILRLGTRPTSDPILANWLAKPLRELGYVEGQNLIVERRYADDKSERLSGLARELVQLRPDVIVAVGTSATQVVKDVTTTIPIVFMTNVDPIAAGLVSSLAQLKRNVTGILIAPEGTLAGKKLELLRELVPRATRIAMLIPDRRNRLRADRAFA
jgi:putative tryptophan/tyrosine transport system substrate-binding protein